MYNAKGKDDDNINQYNVRGISCLTYIFSKSKSEVRTQATGSKTVMETELEENLQQPQGQVRQMLGDNADMFVVVVKWRVQT